MDCNPPGFSVHEILQARILEWVVIPLSRDLLYPGIELGSPALQAASLPSDTAGEPLPGSNLMFSAATWDQFHLLIFAVLTDSHGSHFSFSYYSSVLFLFPWLASSPSIHPHSRYCNQPISIFTWIKKCCFEKGDEESLLPAFQAGAEDLPHLSTQSGNFQGTFPSVPSFFHLDIFWAAFFVLILLSFQSRVEMKVVNSLTFSIFPDSCGQMLICILHQTLCIVI